MKWENIYVPDLTDIFVTPNPNATYKLLDRIIIVRSGYPVNVGAKGTVIAIQPLSSQYTTDLIESELFALDILMDAPYKIKLDACKFERHQIFQTRSTNMLMNISFGRQ